jgi:beta-glucosidase/6-phospho-beta-glucosidase/beta-galactosidase
MKEKATPSEPIFQSNLMGGFECSSHRRRDGRRLDLIEATGHDKYAREDYQRLAEMGIFTARDGIRWHLIESWPGRYDFSSVENQLTAAAESRVQLIWDLFHYGYPDYIDIFHKDFPARLADLGAAFAEFHLRAVGGASLVIPVNEISFFSWIAGDIGRFFPFKIGRGDELKRQLAAAFIAASRAIKAFSPAAKILASEPLVHITARNSEPFFARSAEDYRLSQFQALDMLTGRLAGDLGGSNDILDAIGINYYPHNQWYYPDREMIPLGDPTYRPLRQLLSEAASRYQLPLFISETGTEDDERVPWFRYVAEEYDAAKQQGVDLHGLCLYPVVNHPGWEDERHCHNGLWDYCDELGDRAVHEPLATEIQRVIGRAANSKALSAH